MGRQLIGNQHLIHFCDNLYSQSAEANCNVAYIIVFSTHVQYMQCCLFFCPISDIASCMACLQCHTSSNNCWINFPLSFGTVTILLLISDKLQIIEFQFQNREPERLYDGSTDWIKEKQHWNVNCLHYLASGHFITLQILYHIFFVKEQLSNIE